MTARIIDLREESVTFRTWGELKLYFVPFQVKVGSARVKADFDGDWDVFFREGSTEGPPVE